MCFVPIENDIELYLKIIKWNKIQIPLSSKDSNERRRKNERIYRSKILRLHFQMESSLLRSCLWSVRFSIVFHSNLFVHPYFWSSSFETKYNTGSSFPFGLCESNSNVSQTLTTTSKAFLATWQSQKSKWNKPGLFHVPAIECDIVMVLAIVFESNQEKNNEKTEKHIENWCHHCVHCILLCWNNRFAKRF